MALTAKFYNFTKRKNSTKQPSGVSTDFNVTLKGGSSLLTPILMLHITSRPTFNYLQFEDRYYYITDIVSVRNDLWEIHCAVDALASHKTEIGNSNAMIMYATGGRNDIPDPRIPVEADVIVHTSNAVIPGITISPIGAGSVVLSITGKGSFGDFFLDNRAELPELLDGVDNWIQTQGWQGIDDIINQWCYGGSAANCVKNCIGLPFSLNDQTFSGNVGPSQSLVLGEYPCANSQNQPIMAKRIVNPVWSISKNISIPWEYSDWRRKSPYTSVFMYLPFIGLISLSPDEILAESSLDVKYSINLTSGDISVEVSTSTLAKVLATASANVAMAMTFGSANVSGAKASQAIITGIGGLAFAAATAASGGSLILAGGAMFGGVTSATAGLIGAYGGDTHGGGGLTGGATCGLTDRIMVYTVSKQLTDSQSNLNPLMGKPVMAKHTVGTYSGFVQTDGMCVNGAMTETEYNQINKACDSGIYYE